MNVKQPVIDFNTLNCSGCPARFLKDQRYYGFSGNWSWRRWVEYCEDLRERQIKEIINNQRLNCTF